MRFITVLKSGGDIRPEHALTLLHQIDEHVEGGGHEYWLLTDIEADVRAVHQGAVAAENFQHAGVPFKNGVVKMGKLYLGLPGWWSMLEMFGLMGPAIYMDIDTWITGDLTPFVDVVDKMKPRELAMLRPWNPREAESGRMASGVMAWGGNFTPLYGLIENEKPAFVDHGEPEGGNFPGIRKWGRMVHRGRTWETDQHWIAWHVPRLVLLRATGGDQLTGELLVLQDILPVNYVQSFKRDLDSNIQAASGSIVCFHGKPRPWDIGDAYRMEAPQ